MSDIMMQLVSVYGTRTGEVRLTERQEQALQSACVWQTLNYHFSRFCADAPTFTDAQIVEMCRGYKYIARIARGSGVPYKVIHTSRPAPVPCLSFADAVKCAQEMFRCNLVTVSPDLFRPDFDTIAGHWRVTILIVSEE